MSTQIIVGAIVIVVYIKSKRNKPSHKSDTPKTTDKPDTTSL
jgi:hypothetical protein